MKRFALAFLILCALASPSSERLFFLGGAGVVTGGGGSGDNCATGATADGCVIFAGSTRTLVDLHANVWSFNNSVKFFPSSTFLGYTEVDINGAPSCCTTFGGVDGGGYSTAVMLANGGQVYTRGWLGSWYATSYTNHTVTVGTPTGGNLPAIFAPTRVILGADPSWASIAAGASSQSIGFSGPSDTFYSAGNLAITADMLPTNGTVFLADGVTAVTEGQTLTSAQLTGLKFQPTVTTQKYARHAAFTYKVCDPATSCAIGAAHFTVLPTGLWADPVGSAVSSGSIVAAPTVLQPAVSGDLVGWRFQNASGEGAGYITVSQIFMMGTLQTTDSVCGKPSGGSCTIYVQKDVKSTWPDGSVKQALLSLQVPSFTSSPGYVEVMFATCSGGGCPSAPTAAPNKTTLVASAYDATLAMTYSLNGTGTETAHCGGNTGILNTGTVTNWLSGPVVNEFDAFLTFDAGKLTIECDIRVYSDGSTSTEVIGDNARHFSSGAWSGVEVDYTISMSDGYTGNGVGTIHHQPGSLWHHRINSAGIATPNLQIDVPYLMATGALPFFDHTYGINSGIITSYLGSGFGAGNNFPLTTGGIVTDMGAAGSRPDIGPQPGWMVTWLLSQDSGAWTVMTTAADAGLSVPWHYIDTATGSPPNGETYTNISPPFGSGPWGIDNQGRAHEPDFAYLPYLITGDHLRLRELQGQGDFNILAVPGYGGTNSPDMSGYGNQGATSQFAQSFTTFPPSNQEQHRNLAWNARQIEETAFITPDSDPLHTFFTNAAITAYKGLVQELVANDENAQYGALRGLFGASTGANKGHQSFEHGYIDTALGEGAGMAMTNTTGYALRMAKYANEYASGFIVNGRNGLSPMVVETYYYDVNDMTCCGGTATNLSQSPAGPNAEPPYISWATLMRGLDNHQTGSTGLIPGFQTQPMASYYPYQNENCTANPPLSGGGFMGGVPEIMMFGISSIFTQYPTYQGMQAYAFIRTGVEECYHANPGGINTTNDLQWMPMWNIVPRMPNGQWFTHDHYQFDVLNGPTASLTATACNSLSGVWGNGTITITGSANPGCVDVMLVGNRATGSGTPVGSETFTASTADSWQYGACSLGTFNGGAGNDLFVPGGTCYTGMQGDTSFYQGTSLAAQTISLGTNTTSKTKQIGYTRWDGFTVGLFRPGTDTLKIKSTLNGRSYASAADFTSLCSVVGADTVCDLGTGSTLTVKGVVASLTASVVIF